MVHAGYLRAQAELCFGIARSLSDTIAAKKTLTLANDYVRRAEEVESCNSKQASVKNQPIGHCKEGWTSPSSYFERVYGPETLKIMTDAFDLAHDCLPSRLQGSAHGRRKLAFFILRNMERGERDPTCLAYLAALDFLR
jgi:hypothetical protein